MPEPLKSCPFCGGAAKFIELSKKIIMFQEELIHLSGRYDQLLTAMRTIAGGSFHSATSLAIEGDWKGFTDKLQDIAITALNQTGEL